MAEDCNAFLDDDFVFPRRPTNRPALARIAYRIGAYPDFVEAMTRAINRAPELAAWTHRGADDPGIALLESAAVLGDILSFYQERYANEAYLRTALWRESIAELARLTGYRLAPGVGGRATFAFEVKGGLPVTIPAGFPVKADLEGADAPADFQTDAELTAHAHLSRFHLYRPRAYANAIAAGTTTLELAAVDAVTGPSAADAAQIKAGDRLMLLAEEPAWTTGGGSMSAQQAAQIVKVRAVRRLLDRTLLDLDGAILEPWPGTVRAYRIGRAFRHFGHAAPDTYVRPTSDSSTGKIDGSRAYTTDYRRLVSPTGFAFAPGTLPVRIDPFDDPSLLPLDQEAKDLAANSRFIVQSRIIDPDGIVQPLTVLRTTRATRADTLSLAAVSGTSTVLTLDAPLVRAARERVTVSSAGYVLMQYLPFETDIRDVALHEVTSPRLTLTPPAHDAHGGVAFVDGNQALCFFGSLAQARTLPGRRLQLTDAEGRRAELVCTNLPDDFMLDAGAHEPRLWTLSFDAPPTPWTRADFDEAAPMVTVFGNLADATQGQAEAETVLGNGDARLRFQTFKLPKAPLTYLLSAGATPPYAPALEVRVDGRAWKRVDAFFGQDAKARVYIVREDAEGNSYIQFGDGETGARPPSGLRNVSAVWRTGSGAHGPLKPGATPGAGARVAGLDKLAMPGPVSGGASAESEDKARRAVPGKVQGLGRLVSLADYESETLAIPGVVGARADWGLRDGVAGLELAVLLAAGREAEFEAVRATLQQWQRCRGPDRYPVNVRQAFMRYLWLDVEYAADPVLARADVEAGLRAALGLAGDSANETSGLFGLARRGLGEAEYARRIEGALQNVVGLIWCRVTALGLFQANDPDAPGDDDPANLALPAAPRTLAQSVTPASHELLQLAPTHLTLVAVAAPPGACP